MVKLRDFTLILSEALKETDKKNDPHLFESWNDRVYAYNALACYYLQALDFEQY